MKRLPKAEPIIVEQLNGYKFEYGIKLNIKQLDLECVHVQPSFEVSSEILRKNYINKINKMKIADAISFINSEIEDGYLSNNLYISFNQTMEGN
ncbi:MAG: hypothetical protein U9N34_08085 [Candidatus Cloacimonadota bacterium]|nr:hypothetical protein [Candidatus Cloacimonadota bacterium]